MEEDLPSPVNEAMMTPNVAHTIGYSPDALKMVRTIGKGNFGKVVLVFDCIAKKFAALKIVKKQLLVTKKQVQHLFNESYILANVSFPFLVISSLNFQDDEHVYFLSEYLAGGDLYRHLRKETLFDEERVAFYCAQICLALEYLHSLQIIHRDIKPENILLNRNGYIKLIDFGFAKLLTNRISWTMCGTPEYLAPEIILQKGYSFSADWWSFGVVAFELAAGYSPFFADNDNTIVIMENIVQSKYACPDSFSAELRHLLKQLLRLDLTERIGCLFGGVNDIKHHPFFASMNWPALLAQEIPATFVPVCLAEGDSSNFDSYAEDTVPLFSVSGRPVHEFKFSRF